MFIFPNTTIHDTDVLVHNILIMLEKKIIPKINLIIVYPCTKICKTYYTISQEVHGAQTLLIYKLVVHYNTLIYSQIFSWIFRNPGTA